ncbi:MAG: PHP domain-containing protein, partial [Clostridia bacterium]|nr:PHP domain-containing protein [Clostridia bacterium]
MSCKFSEIFEGFENKDKYGLLSESEVLSYTLKNDDKILELTLFSKTYIPSEYVFAFRSDVAKNFGFDAISLLIKYESEAFCEQACKDLFEVIKVKYSVLKGALNRAEISLKDNTVTVELKYGGLCDVLNLGADKLFQKAVSDRFGVDVELEFTGVCETDEMLPPPIDEAPPPPPVYASEAKPTEVAPSAPKKVYDYKPEGGLPVYLESAELVWGRKLDTNTKAMIDVGEEDKTISCWGEVFGVEWRDIKTKRGDTCVLEFSFSDHTNSLTASMFVKPDEKDKFKAIKNGNYILVNGSYDFDTFKRDFIVKPKAIATLVKYTEKDNYDGPKRVELHCHTNMSAKDAVCSAGDIIKQAHSWGHKAVAITDHG